MQSKIHFSTVVKSILCAYLCILAFKLDLCYTASANTVFWLRYTDSLKPFSILEFFFFVGLALLFYVSISTFSKNKPSKRMLVCSVIPAALFSIFMVIGAAFVGSDSLSILCKDFSQVLKTLTIAAGYFIVALPVILFLFSLADRIPANKPFNSLDVDKYSNNAILSFCFRHPFRSALIILIIAYIPYCIVSYPAILQGDAYDMIMQWFGEATVSTKSVNLIDPTVTITNSHPVIYSGFLYACLKIGHAITGSYKNGLFLASLIQMMFSLSVVSYLISRLVKHKCNLRVILGVFAYYIFSPRIKAYMFLVSKEVIYSYALLLVMVIIMEMILSRQKEKLSPLCTASLICMCFLVSTVRNEGKLLIVELIILLAIFVKEYRKVFIKLLITMLALTGLYSLVLLPSLGITGGSVREPLSVPFQQTARYVKYYSDEVTQEEKDAINKILPYDQIAELYNPDISDLVKNQFKKSSTTEDLLRYFAVWAKMGLKHPGTYISAYLNNYYEFLYPGEPTAYHYSYEWSQQKNQQFLESESAQAIGLDFSYPSGLSTLRNTLDLTREGFFSLPIFNFLLCPSFYVWTVILLLFFGIKNSSKPLLLSLIPLMLSIGMAMLGPCNGFYFRYLFIVAVGLPLPILLFRVNGNQNLTQFNA